MKNGNGGGQIDMKHSSSSNNEETYEVIPNKAIRVNRLADVNHLLSLLD